MDEFKLKIKRMKPLVRSRKISVDQESSALASIRAERQNMMSELKKFERLYIQSVEELNRVRQSPLREHIEVLENGVDEYKSSWYRALTSLHEIESRERSQIQQLLMVQKDLKSMEKLEERYISQLANAEKLREQKLNDEASLQNFAKQNAKG